MFGVCFVFATILSVIGSILINWGKKYSYHTFLFLFPVLFLLPILFTLALNLFIETLKEHGFITYQNGILLLIITLVILRIVWHYKKHPWKIFLMEASKDDIIPLSTSFDGIKDKDKSQLFFIRKIYLFDIERLYTFREAKWQKYNYTYEGSTHSLTLTYFSKSENKIYKGNFSFSQKALLKHMSRGLLYPFGNRKKYNQINIAINNKGKINLQLGNTYRDFLFFTGKCNQIKKEDLYTDEARKIKEYTNINSSPSIQEKDFTISSNIIIKHKIEGLTKQIVSAEAMTFDGERYTIPKTYWDGKKHFSHPVPLAAISLLIINNKGESITCDYTYDKQNILTLINTNSIHTIHELIYSFRLHTKEQNLLNATSYEFINGIRYEFKVEGKLTKVP